LHHQPNHLTDTPEHVQRLILLMLLRAREDKFWPLEGLVHETGNAILALDALAALSDAGLIHRRGQYVFPTRAAMHYHYLFG
jgi:hypothetical protein